MLERHTFTPGADPAAGLLAPGLLAPGLGAVCVGGGWALNILGWHPIISPIPVIRLRTLQASGLLLAGGMHPDVLEVDIASVLRAFTAQHHLPGSSQGCSPCTDQPQGHVSSEHAARLPDMLDEANCRCLYACSQAAPCSADLQEAAELGIVRCLSQKVTQCSAPCTGPGADSALAAAGFWLGAHAGCTTWGRVHVNG